MCKAAKKTEGYVNPAKSGWIKKDARLAIYLRDSFMCLICLKDLRNAAPFDITLDHIVCAVDGGSNASTNVYTCCRKCNCTRQDKPLTRFTSKEAVKQIRRNVKRSMTRYRKLAKALISGETGFEAEFTKGL